MAASQNDTTKKTEIKNEDIASSEFEVIVNKLNHTSVTAKRETNITDLSKIEETQGGTLGLNDIADLQNDTSEIKEIEFNITGTSKIEKVQKSTAGVDPIGDTLNVTSEKEEKEGNFSAIEETYKDIVTDEHLDNPNNNTSNLLGLDKKQKDEKENSSTIQVEIDNTYNYNIFINQEISIEDLEILQNVNSKTSEIEISDQDCDEADDDVEKPDDE